MNHVLLNIVFELLNENEAIVYADTDKNDVWFFSKVTELVDNKTRTTFKYRILNEDDPYFQHRGRFYVNKEVIKQTTTAHILSQKHMFIDDICLDNIITN
jgi:hypothetical protein